MKKLVRILSLILMIRSKTNYSRGDRRSLIRNLLFLEYKTFTKADLLEPIQANILNFRVHAYGYRNLALLFNEIFVQEEYKYFSANDEKVSIVDCGANIGIATLYLKWKFPQATIYSFEPDPAAFSMLEKNVNSNKLSNIHLYNNAAMAAEGEIDFFTAEKSQASLMMSTNEGRMNERKIRVKGIDFPDFIKQKKPLLMKMDIEGAEKAVFDKMDKTGALRQISQIIMEYHHKINGAPSNLSQIFKLLEKNGFEYNLLTRFEKANQFQDILIYAYRPKL